MQVTMQFLKVRLVIRYVGDKQCHSARNEELYVENMFAVHMD